MSEIQRIMTKSPQLKSAPSDIRINNIQAVFDLLFPSEQMSRAELGRRVGLSRMAISEVVKEMVENHLLREVGIDSRKGRGKRSVVLAIDTNYWRTISLDVSQQISDQFTIRGALTDLCGRIVERVEIPGDGLESIRPATVLDVCTKLLRSSDRPVLGIGVAVPGVVNDNGTVVRSVILGWSDEPLREMIEEKLKVPTTVGNDTNMALIAERFFGGCSPNSMFVKIDQGIGSAVSVNDDIVKGHDFAAGEIGHVVIDPNGPQCVCGKRGCLEAILSAPKLRKHIADNPDHRTQILADAGQRLGQALSMSIGLLDLSDISVFGPPEIVGEAFLGSMREELDADVSTDYHTPPSLHRCQQGEDVVLRGQAVSVIRSFVATTRQTPENPQE
ncbi:MAG: ROK family transcriptional regulator [Bifidobacteriaceae bacterium]|jgi:predicted NBD/HSP70 family sugar kinase/biotin operon repressor|nr:ROK family transcriptional regulator [Bifidobacteriaceae bacterium]